MRRLFRMLFAHGLVMVATSNRPPDQARRRRCLRHTHAHTPPPPTPGPPAPAAQLYLNGIQRSSFLPFIDDLAARCEAPRRRRCHRAHTARSTRAAPPAGARP